MASFSFLTSGWQMGWRAGKANAAGASVMQLVAAASPCLHGKRVLREIVEVKVKVVVTL